MKVKQKNTVKRIVDVVLTILLLCLMAYQVTGALVHEWVGVSMTVLVIVHQVLNIKWYGALLKGKYHALRIVQTAVNVLLLAAFALTAFSGMSMSGYAVPFLYGMAKVSLARKLHLAMSHWAFVLMGIHLGLHIPVMTAKMKMSGKTRTILSVVFSLIAGGGLFFFLKNGIAKYLFFRAAFAFMAADKAAALVFAEHILMLLFWAFFGAQTATLCKKAQRKDKADKKKALFPVLMVVVSVLIGSLLLAVVPSDDGGSFSPGTFSQGTTGTQTADNTPPQGTADDQFILIEGGTYLMGSPDSENWRIDDERQHEVTVASFYMDAYETTQADYEQLTGENPSSFEGKELPVENISWLDAIQFANAKSKSAGLTPAYTVTESSVEWDRGADGYRLPTEAEWEYACRAGTVTPFNTEQSISSDEANFYGHYPYEIEENYFDNSSLDAKPGEYRQTTVTVGSFRPNQWGLYDCHGNVNEWCWDYYGDYDTNHSNNPTGAPAGTRHIYRGGGWNDFAKNMRSAYRAAGQVDMKSYNLGVRLVRNADSSLTGTVTAAEGITPSQTSGKVLIAYFSWGGNTRGVAEEIQKQTGADIFEITPVHPYSTDYNTVLMEAQEDQHRQARPELTATVDNMDSYDTILLGYPNWWASIPMPIATFLESYDFSGKRIVPFCSHGGGRFGQSLTAIAKLAPAADIGEGLSVHYDGGDTLPEDVAAWLDTNGINH